MQLAAAKMIPAQMIPPQRSLAAAETTLCGWVNIAHVFAYMCHVFSQMWSYILGYL